MLMKSKAVLETEWPVAEIVGRIVFYLSSTQTFDQYVVIDN